MSSNSISSRFPQHCFKLFNISTILRKWIKSGLLVAREDNDAKGTFEDVSAPEHVPSP
ncbi:hypothetical protein V6Z11_D10G176200 [Gossypium hirsutum]